MTSRLLLLASLLAAQPAVDPTASQRLRMVEQQIAARGVSDPQVLTALREVPRHLFVPEELRGYAYDDHPLPIGEGQTISQPYIVGLMTELLRLEPEHRVLEVGTGSGYQAAVLARLVREVYSVEILEPLASSARERLARLGYGNVRVLRADGYYGWSEAAPFDAIIVTCAGGHVPPPLLRQLRPGGRMVMPVGSPFMAQQLVLVEKSPDGTLSQRNVLPVMFVRLLGH